MIRVVLADDQDLIRAGFRALLDFEPDLTVVGEAADGAAAVDLTRRLVPDIALLDVKMPVMDGIAATEAITTDERLTGVQVIILTNYDLDHHVYSALRNGASGFLVKDTQPAELLRALRVVATGEALLSPRVTRRLIEAFVSRPVAPVPSSAIAGLTPREHEILALVARGLSNAKIAETLVISHATVKSHISRVLTKLSARDRAQLVMHAYEAGIVVPGGG